MEVELEWLRNWGGGRFGGVLVWWRNWSGGGAEVGTEVEKRMGLCGGGIGARRKGVREVEEEGGVEEMEGIWCGGSFQVRVELE